VVHTQLSTAALWGSLAARWTRRPVLAHVRALNTKWCYLLADRIVANSHGVKLHLMRQGVPEARIAVIYNGIDPDCYQTTLTPAEARQQCGLPSNGAIIGVVAHLTAKKGHAAFLQAAAALQRSTETTFLLLGEGPERARLEGLAATLGLTDRVVFAGFHENVCPWMRAMDIVVLPSIAMEGFGRVLVEAALMGKPAVTTDLGGTAEVVEDGVTGFVVPPGDVTALTRAMQRLLEDAPARHTMGEAARRRALRLFTVDRMVRETEAAYHALLHLPIEPGAPLTSDTAHRHAAL
jgi:glycosyltransferase involved in cell wall biosynthesis